MTPEYAQRLAAAGQQYRLVAPYITACHYPRAHRLHDHLPAAEEIARLAGLWKDGKTPFSSTSFLMSVAQVLCMTEGFSEPIPGQLPVEDWPAPTRRGRLQLASNGGAR